MVVGVSLPPVLAELYFRVIKVSLVFFIDLPEVLANQCSCPRTFVLQRPLLHAHAWPSPKRDRIVAHGVRHGSTKQNGHGARRAPRPQEKKGPWRTACVKVTPGTVHARRVAESACGAEVGRTATSSSGFRLAAAFLMHLARAAAAALWCVTSKGLIPHHRRESCFSHSTAAPAHWDCSERFSVVFLASSSLTRHFEGTPQRHSARSGNAEAQISSAGADRIVLRCRHVLRRRGDCARVRVRAETEEMGEQEAGSREECSLSGLRCHLNFRPKSALSDRATPDWRFLS